MTSLSTMAVAIACAAGAAGCASQVGGPRAGGVPAARPEQVSATVSAEIRAPIAEVFRYMADEGTPARNLRPYGLAPPSALRELP